MKNAVAIALAAGLFAAGLAAGVTLASGQQQQPAAKEDEQQHQQDGNAPAPLAMHNKSKKITLIADETVVRVAPDSQLHPGGVDYLAMTFNGTVPGPLIDVNMGDVVEVTLVNRGDIVHSLNFHAAVGPRQVLSEAVGAGQSKSWSFVASTPGAFLYHCDGDNLNGIWEHIASGMYGGIVVRSGDERPAKEFYVAFGELYNSADAGMFAGTSGKVGSFDIEKFVANKPDLILTNGMAYRYIPHFGTAAKIALNPNAEEFDVRAGELTRWYIVNAGPRGTVAFNFGSGMIGNVDGRPLNDETWSIPPGSASVIETVFPEEGVYFGNDHDLGRLLAGAGFVVHATGGNPTITGPAAGPSVR
jgi:nitrite reductase (NO-forming)